MSLPAGVGIALACALPLVLGSASTASDLPGLTRHEYAHGAMGTEFRIILYSGDREIADAAAKAAFARIDALDSLLSDYRTESEVSALSRTAGTGRLLPLAPDTWRVLLESERVAAGTGGAFDVTVGALSRLWRWSARRGRVPDAERLREAHLAVGHEALRLDPVHRTAALLRPGMRIDLGGIAKGYAVDAAFERLRDFGIERALVDGGGDLRLGAPPPGRDGWTAAVPRRGASGELIWRTREAAWTAIATSGPSARSLVLDGVRHSHVIDPRSGRSVTTDRWVTVLAATAARADALASALSVLGPAGSENARALGATETWVIEPPRGARGRSGHGS